MTAIPKATPKTIRFTVGENIELVADTWGSPDAHPVLFLHGGGQTRHSWGGAASALAEKGWYALSLDLRGHGESGWSPDGQYELSNFADDIVYVVEALKRPAVLVGASLGGGAIMAAVGEAERTICAGIILVDIAPRAEKIGVERVHTFLGANPDGFASIEEAADAVAQYRQHRKRPKDISGLKKNLRLREDGRYYWHWDPRMLSDNGLGHSEIESRLCAAMGNIRVPVLVVRGRESDVLSMEGVRDLQKLAPHAEFVDVSGAGHMVAGDNNDNFTAAVVEFLTTTFT